MATLFVCRSCQSFRCISLRILLQHIHSVHSQDLNFKIKCCINDCPFYFVKYNSLYKHTVKHHKNEYYCDNNNHHQQSTIHHNIINNHDVICESTVDELIVGSFSINNEAETAANSNFEEQSDASDAPPQSPLDSDIGFDYDDDNSSYDELEAIEGAHVSLYIIFKRHITLLKSPYTCSDFFCLGTFRRLWDFFPKNSNA